MIASGPLAWRAAVCLEPVLRVQIANFLCKGNYTAAISAHVEIEPFVPVFGRSGFCLHGGSACPDLSWPVDEVEQVSGDKEACAKLAEIAKPDFKAGSLT